MAGASPAPDRPTAPELTAPLFDDRFHAGDPHPWFGRLQRLVDNLPAVGPVDIVATLAAPLPLMMICSSLGLPEEDWPTFLVVVNQLLIAGVHRAVMRFG